LLKGVHPLLNPDLLHALACMGHGDSIAIVDSNFPAFSTAIELPVAEPLLLGVDAIEAVKVILTALPIDTFNPEQPAVMGMQVVDQPDAIPDVVREASPLFEEFDAAVTLIERFAFYKAAKQCFALVKTTENRPYGNFIIRKGVIF